MTSTCATAAWWRISLALVIVLSCDFLVNAARQNPLKDPKICGRPQCELISDKFQTAKKIFHYNYRADVRTEFVGTGQNISKLFVEAKLDLLFTSLCEGFLRVNEVQLWEKEPPQHGGGNDQSGDFYDYYNNEGAGQQHSDDHVDDDSNNGQHPKSVQMADDLKRHLLRFSFQDGLIAEVCPNVEEPAWVINFKKGILSAFQHTVPRIDVDFNTTEIDVSGECNVQYTLENTANAYATIRKTKDIGSCKQRYSTHSMLQTTPYTFRDDKTIWPILSSESECLLTVDRNLYREIACVERHLLIPFSNSSSGAVTTVNATMKLQDTEGIDKDDDVRVDTLENIERRSSLIFDHTPSTKPTHGEIKASRELLKEMCTYGAPYIRREFIDVFTNFLQTTKSLDYKTLTQLLARSRSTCDNGRNHVLESLPYIGSSASYQMMRDQIVAGGVSKTLGHSWMTTLAFIRRPDEETLDTFYTILDYGSKQIDPEYTLGASAVIHSYCRHNSECASNERVQKIVNLLETDFLRLYSSSAISGDRRGRERMIVVLKGLGNIGVVSSEFAEKLQAIITDETGISVDLRLNAVMAFRRVDCERYQRFFLDTLANQTLNTEVRIYSYLQAMRCPDYKSIKEIRTILELEQVNQVGSFVWSHLKNLAKSSSPLSIEAQGLLLDDDLSDRFKLDIRKFSRNYEHSLFFDEFNFGTTTDLNLIFGTESYIPRQANLNFTTHLFGQSVNFFEWSLRAEGFEDLVASIFGPKGQLSRAVFRKKMSFFNRWLGNESSEDDDTLENILNLENLRLRRDTKDAADESSTEDLDDFEDPYEFEEDMTDRPKRSLPDQAADRKKALQNDIDGLGYKLNYAYNNPRAQVGLRIFGNDLRHYSIDGMLEVMALAKEFDPFFQASKILSGKAFSYSESRVFLDASYIAPLSIGIPLAIHAFGASSLDMRVSGNLERVESMPAWHFDVEGRFKPSISVDVITTMQTDLFYAISGIKVKSNLYSNSEVEAKLKVRGKNLVSLAFNLPQEKNEIFSARSELLVMKDVGEAVPQAGIEKRSANSTCTWPLLDTAVGLKMCSFYSVPDVSEPPEGAVYPTLLLSGPLNFSIVLTKSDPTARDYLFEYKWDQEGKDANWSLVFHTPGSAIKRLLVTNVTAVAGAFNASVSFVNGQRTASAGCNYNNDPDSRALDLFLDTNGNRSFNLNMELKRWQDRTAWVYKPRMLLTVKDVNVTGLVGEVRMNEKNGISQTDVELSFETRKLQVLLRGLVMKSEITTSTNMTINYRFQANDVETINLAGKLVNTGDKSKTEYRGDMKLRTSAYPKLNFASNVTWLSVQGHTEGVLTYNNAPNLMDAQYTSQVRLIFARSHSEDHIWEGSRTRASFELTVPRSKIDFRFLVKHEERSKNGTEHNFIIGLRYAPEKEATGIFSIHLPRRSLFAVDSYMNITIPEFNTCEVRFKLTEIQAKDYMINFNGSWFTGHSISVKGNYKDRSSRVQALHHIKLIVESPSFEATSLNVVYRRSQLVIFMNAQSKYGKDPYGLTVQYATNVDNKNTSAEVRLKVRDKLYWLNSKLMSEQPKMLQVEVHLDKLRDIHVKIGVLTMEQRKELSFELKWDANRDPTQRLGLLAEYNNPGGDRYSGSGMIAYPERTLSCGFDTYTGGPQYYGTVRAAWSVNDLVVFTYDAGLMPGEHINSWVSALITTPFEGWRTNSFRAGIYNFGNLMLANTSLLLANDQRLEIGYKSDYELEEPVLRFEVRGGINSTIRDIPTIDVKLRHWQNQRKADTEVALRYSGPNVTLNVYSIKSGWELSEDERFQNVSGTVLMISPFEGYRKGGLVAQFSLNNLREVRGAASLNFDIREFTLAMSGYVKRFTDNMLSVNITTPLEKFRTINGRFGLNERRRHAVAQISTPDTALGVEVLCDISTLMNFDVILSVATPVEGLEHTALYAKMNAEEVDMRGMWNHTTTGFMGVWRRSNATDFEYSYRVFTPLAGYEENGFVAQFVKRTDIFVLQLHGKFSRYKLGVKMNGHPKSTLINRLGGDKMELEILYDDDFQPPRLGATGDQEEIDYLDTVDYDEFFSYFLQFEVDTLLWPTVDGVIDVQEIMDFYLVVANLQLPAGRVDAKNRLYFPDYMNVLNVLNVQLPFNATRDVKAIVEYHVDLDFNSFYEKLHVIVADERQATREAQLELNYTRVEDALKPHQHAVHLNLKTPFELLPFIMVNGRLELDDNMHRGNVSIRSSGTFLSLAGSVETEENFLETSLGVLLSTHVLPHYSSRLYIKHDQSLVDDYIDVRINVADHLKEDSLQFAYETHKNPQQVVNAKALLRTTMLPLRTAQMSILLTEGANRQLNFDLLLLNQRGQRMEYGTRATKKKEVFNVEVWTPLQHYRNISMHGSLTPTPNKPNEYQVSGQLYRNMATYALNGVVQLDASDGYPETVRLRVQPKAGGRDGILEYSVSPLGNDRKGASYQLSAAEDGRMVQLTAGWSLSDVGGDISLLVESSEPEIARINANGKLQLMEHNHAIVDFTLNSPWRDYGLETVSVHSETNFQRNGGKVSAEYDIGGSTGKSNSSWTWQPGADMQLSVQNAAQLDSESPARTLQLAAKYVNPERSFLRLTAGVSLDVESKWQVDLAGSVNYRSVDDCQAQLVSQLPLPVGDVHRLSVRYLGNLISAQGMAPNVFIETRYNSDEAKNRFMSRLNYRNVSDLQGLAHAEWGVDNDMAVVEGDFQMLRKPEVRREFYAKLITPLYKDANTFFMRGNYDHTKEDYHNLFCTIDYPTTRRIADIDVSIQSLSNMNGHINCTTPQLNMTWFRTDFNLSRQDGDSYRYMRATWPDDTAHFKMHSVYTSSQSWNDDVKGNIELEVPLAQRHRADITYSLNGRQSEDNGQVEVTHNGQQILHGLYKRRMSFNEPHYIDTTDISLENHIKPLGIHYVHSIDGGGNPTANSNGGAQQQQLDVKHVEVFELRNAANFNLTGELHNHQLENGQQIKIVAIHPNRTVVLTTTFDEHNEQVFSQRTRLDLSPTVWIGYNVKMGNYSKPGNDTQDFVIELSYPRRTLTTEGWYYITEDRFNSSLAFKWTGGSSGAEDTADGGASKQPSKPKIVRTGLVWQLEPLKPDDRDHQSFCFTLGHPHLEKDVTLRGTYYRGKKVLLSANVLMDYSNNPDHLVDVGLVLHDLYHTVGHTNYTLNMHASHPASDLDVLFDGSAVALASFYRIESHAHYKRDYFAQKHAKFVAMLDVNRREVEYERSSPTHSVRFWAIPHVQYPIYGLNATVWDTPETNNTGYVYMNLLHKFARMEFNLTDDASQNLQMFGHIPDSRSGYLDIWRNYDEIRIIDVSSYLNMNHSRLITGRFHWRPRIRMELKEKFHALGKSLYNSFSEGIDFWIQTMYSEGIDTMGVVWDTAHDYNARFFEEIGELSVLDDDLESLRSFLNQSYEANDFYIKTMVNFTLTVLDELAIRDHIESLPKIFSEIWQAMGDSGKALRKSIVWLIEAIRSTYNKLLEAVNRFFHGESLRYLSGLMENAVHKYDRFVKNLHISFIKYVDQLWNRFWVTMEKYWKSVLKRLEPHIFKLVSYVETTAWEFSKEVFDFIYKRTNELAESPYFNKVSTFTQDLDRLYRDIKSHDALTNVKKYTSLAWHFVKEKYFKLVPFGAELNEILTEIWDEVKELQKIDQVQIVLQKYQEVIAKLEWIAEELQLENRLHELYALLRNKFQNYALNALETANQYREAKTKFVFDPEAGIIDLEQKLPMSWHAFNETPKFEEIPEYRVLARAQNLFANTNVSLIRYIYNLKSHLDPKTWLPPYRARALLIDSRHYMTFDQRFVGLNLHFEEITEDQRRNAQCSYLLAHDFHQRNFSLLLEPSPSGLSSDIIATRKLTLMVKGELIEIDLGNDSLVVNGNVQPMLPLALHNALTIHRDQDILTIHAMSEDGDGGAAFGLHCNMQFSLCWLEVSGWYFGRTAGILGTMNNEHYDEYTTQSHEVVPLAEVERFTDSWSLHGCRQQMARQTATSIVSESVAGICKEFFHSGSTSNCGDTIDVTPFYNMCLDLGGNANPMRDGHPAVKGACTAALAYIEACAAVKIPLRVPHQCVFCPMEDGKYVPEGVFVELSGAQVPHGSDVVFIVEAKPCNDNLAKNKSIMLLASMLQQQLTAHRIKDNRYAVLTFGGAAPFDKPRTVIHENRVFVNDSRLLERYFSHITTADDGSTNRDILQAISSASRLNFRPGVSKTFILLPCSRCAAQDMLFDYKSIAQYMLEEGVTLHVLADIEFEFERTRKMRHFFGLDRELVYSKRHPQGDAETRPQLQVPRSELGICTPLALETGGSVFSGRKLIPERKHPIQRLASIFAKRVAQSAMPHANQTCECSGHNTGVAYMACSPSAYPDGDEHNELDDYDLQFSNFDWEEGEEEEIDA